LARALLVRSSRTTDHEEDDMISAHDVMTEDPATISMTATVGDAVRILQTLDVRHLPVVDDDGLLVGMLSDRDLRALTFPEVLGEEYSGQIQAALDTPISTIMSSDVFAVEVEDDVSLIIELMLDHKIGAVPVVDTDDTLVGIVSYVDLLRQLSPDDRNPRGRVESARTPRN
jgi:acetoin utilization protein AcuB